MGFLLCFFILPILGFHGLHRVRGLVYRPNPLDLGRAAPCQLGRAVNAVASFPERNNTFMAPADAAEPLTCDEINHPK